MTRSVKAAVIGLLLVLIVAAVAFVWYILKPQVLIDTDTLTIDTIPHGGLKITDKTAGMVYIVKRKCVSMNP